MILYSTKCGGNLTKDVEVGPDRRTDGQEDRQTGRFIYAPQAMLDRSLLIFLMGLTDHLKIGLVCWFKMKYVHLVSTV
jgi:hypothetical protein